VKLVESAGKVVSRDALVEAGWGSVAVTDDSLKQSILRLRKALAAHRNGSPYIETVPNHGYRFIATVERAERHDVEVPDADLAPYRAFVQGRADLHTLNRDKIKDARTAFEHVLQRVPDYAPAHVGLANACALTFEATRVDAVCDLESLRHAIRHARRGTTLAPASGEAWSTLAFALYLHGDPAEAVAAACKAVDLEPDDWRHSLRLAYVSWGEERIRAARELLRLCPGLALAHWLIATVLIARGAFEAALFVLQEGCRAQDTQSATADSFPAVGLHLLRGLVLGAQDRLDRAAQEFTHELTFVEGGQLYARECAANTWYALGAIRLRQKCREEAEHAFCNALDVAPGHPFAAAALGPPFAEASAFAKAPADKTGGKPVPTLEDRDPRFVDAAIASAVGLVRAGRHADAAQAYREAVLKSTLPSAGWILPVEPLINPASHPDVWADTLAIVRQRAI
jgi:tetratricopeptide (TPR) repeat protein